MILLCTSDLVAKFDVDIKHHPKTETAIGVCKNLFSFLANAYGAEHVLIKELSVMTGFTLVKKIISLF